MLALSATEVRKDWSSVIDSVVKEKPAFIKRTRDNMWFSNLETMSEILAAYQFTALGTIQRHGTLFLSKDR